LRDIACTTDMIPMVVCAQYRDGLEVFPLDNFEYWDFITWIDNDHRPGFALTGHVGNDQPDIVVLKSVGV